MSGKNTENKKSKDSHVMSIRFDGKTYKKLEELSKEKNMKKSKLIKTAFNKWTNLNKSPLLFDSINLGKFFMRNLFNLISEEKLKDLGNDLGEHWIDILKIRIIDKQMEKNMISLLSVFKEGIGPNQASWFEKIDFRVLDTGNVIVYGIHSLDQNFSLFFKFFTAYLMKRQFNYDLIEKPDNLSKKTVELEFQASNKK